MKMGDEQKLSLFEAYLTGMGQLVAWLFPAIVTGVVVALAQRALLPPPSSTRGGNS
jgi:hypothetical protein